MPEAGNPQAWNRYSYVVNNPLRYVDPTGHICYDPELDAAWNCGGTGFARYGPDPQIAPFPSFEEAYGVTFGPGWSPDDQLQVVFGVQEVASALAAATPEADTPDWVFRSVFGPITFAMLPTTVGGYYCERSAGHGGVACYANAAGRIAPHLAVHELGHVFNAVIANTGGVTPYANLARLWQTDRSFPRRDPENIELRGYAGRRWGWQQSAGLGPEEEFADMFLGWVFNRWEVDPLTGGLRPAGQARSVWMATNMTVWIARATGP